MPLPIDQECQEHARVPAGVDHMSLVAQLTVFSVASIGFSGFSMFSQVKKVAILKISLPNSETVKLGSLTFDKINL